MINFLLAFPRLKDFEMKIKRSKPALRSNSKIFVFVLSMGKNKSVLKNRAFIVSYSF